MLELSPTKGWKKSDTVLPLSPFACFLLDDHRTLWARNPQPESSVDTLVEWPGFQLDVYLMCQVAELLWKQRTVSDQQFLAESHLPILELLGSSPIFSRLSDPNIQVTKGHRGLRPSCHISNVMQSMRTDSLGLSSTQVFQLRFSAYFHDLGKAVSAGIPAAEVQTYMASFDCPHHSFPNHDLLSSYVLEKMLDHSFSREMISLMGKKTWEQILMIIRNHHLLDIKSETGEKKISMLRQQMSEIIHDHTQFEAVLLTYVFNYADIMATPDYQKYWPKKIELLQQILSEFSSLIDLNTQKLLFQIITELNPGLSISILHHFGLANR